MSADFFTAAERTALDSFTVPAMRAGLATTIVTSASAGAVPSRRSSRGGWRRHGGLLLGAGALVLASATAAATGWLGKLPIAIPGITQVAGTPVAKPKPVAHAPKPRPTVGKPVALAALPVADPSPDLTPLTPGEQWKARRDARIAAGLPVQRPMMQRIMADRLAKMPPEQREAAIDEWRRIKALPMDQRKAAIAKIRADYLAMHPRMAARYQQKLEARSAAAADGKPMPQPGALPPPDAQAQGRPPLTPEQRAERRQRWQEWRARRAQRLQTGQ